MSTMDNSPEARAARTEGGSTEGQSTAPVAPAGTGDNRPESREERTAPEAETVISDGSTVADPAAGGVGDEAAAPPAASEWTGPSQDEWKNVNEAALKMQRFIEQFSAPEEEPQLTEEQLKGMDIRELMDYAVDSRLQHIQPYIEAAARSEGAKLENEAFDALQKTYGDFDRDVAHRFAESFFAETGDPMRSLDKAAQFSAEIRKRERQAGIEDYKKTVGKRNDGEPPAGGGATRVVPPAKSYDEVVERWSNDTEV